MVFTDPMNPLFQIVLDFAILAAGLTFVVGGLRGVIYPSARGGHQFRRPLYLKSTAERIAGIFVGLVLLVWLIVRLGKLIWA
jgi:hypothetical protein